MPHFCADCRYEYNETAFETAQVGEYHCPKCGSTRVSVQIEAPPILMRVTVPTPMIVITTHMWHAWLRIAIEHAKEAHRVREEITSLGEQGNVAPLLGQEFHASIVAVAGSAHALDALYGATVIPQSVRDQWRQKGTKRHGKIREALKQIFDTGRVNQKWVAEFEWLFDLRDAAAHAEERPKETVPHATGVHTSPEQANYSLESAEKAVELALSVLRWCVDHPRPNVPEAIQWASSTGSAVAELELLWSS